MMAISLFDHDRRIHDVEVALKALLDLLLIETPSANEALAAATRTLSARGETGAASLLTDAARRSYAR